MKTTRYPNRHYQSNGGTRALLEGRPLALAVIEVVRNGSLQSSADHAATLISAASKFFDRDA